MKFIKVGNHYINLYNVNHVLRRNKNTVEIYFSGSGNSFGTLLNLQGKDADEFEQQLNNLCD